MSCPQLAGHCSSLRELKKTRWTDWYATLETALFELRSHCSTVFVSGAPSTGAIANLSVPVPTAMTITDAKRLTNGSFQFTFTNSPGALFGVLATSNLSLPLTNWTIMAGVTEFSPGQFRFTDPRTNATQQFYRLRSP